MADHIIQGSNLRAEDKLDKLRQQIHEKKFLEVEQIRQFVNRYVTANPDQARSRSTNAVDELVGNIRAELGLTPAAQPGVTQMISDHVRDLVRGRAQASEDTARWAVHHAANQVTMYSGQFVYDANDIFIDGAGMDFLFRRTYKSQGYYNGPLGVNWDHSYNLCLRTVDGGQRLVRLTGGFQESAYPRHGLYGQAGFNYWVPPPGEHSIIFDVQAHAAEFGVQVPPGCQQCRYGLRLPDGTVYFYEIDPDYPDPNLYRVKRIGDRLGNYLEFSYRQADNLPGGHLEKVTINNPARQVIFEYDTQDRITCIADYIGRTWRYDYDDYADLVAFTTPGTGRYPEGLTERYVYSTPYYAGELQHRLLQVYDTAGRLDLENEHGTDKGLLSYNRVIRQREGGGERFFEYEDVSLATGLPAGQPEIEEDFPAHQTVITRRNGHLVHHIYNKFGNLIAREEDAWASGSRQRLVTHYRYNRDGALIGEVSPEGRITQYLYGRDDFMRQPGVADLSEEELRQHGKLTWKRRLGFGNRLAVVRRFERSHFSSFQFPSPLRDLHEVAIHPKDIVVKFTYAEDAYQNITSISHPRYTQSPFADGQESPQHVPTLTTFEYDPSQKQLKRIKYPDCTRDGQPEVADIEEQFLDYDPKGRLTEYQDRTGTHTALAYFPAKANPNDPEAAKEGYLQSQAVDPQGPNTPSGLGLTTEYQVNQVGVVTQIRLPKGIQVGLEVNDLNQAEKVTRILKSGVAYETRYTYCRNMRVERVERDVQDQGGQPVWGGTEVRFFHYDENDNIVREQLGGLKFDDHLITRHCYDDGDLRVATTLPRGNRIRINYDERRLPVKITRGAGSQEAVEVSIAYDGDGLIIKQRDGRGLGTEFEYDSFGRVVATRDYDEQDNLYRLIRQDYDKAGNLTIERLFVADDGGFRSLSHAQYIYNELSQLIETRLRLFQAPIAYQAADVKREHDEVPLAEAVRTLYFYDKAGRLTRLEQRGKRLDAGGNPEANETVLVSTYTYNSVGWLRGETDPLGSRTETYYDEHGLATRVDVHEKVPDSPTGEEVFTTLYAYDDLDRLVSVTDSLGNVTSFEYDSRNAVVRQVGPLGNATRFDYDIYGRRVAERIEMTDTGLGGGPRQPDSDIVTQFVYDTNGNLIRLIDAHGTPTDQAHDALDRRSELKYADGTATRYRYDGNDNLVGVQDNNGLIRRTSYDPLNHPVYMEVDTGALKPNLAVEGATFEAFEYNALGQLTRVQNDYADIHFRVDSLGRVYEESTKFSDLASTYILKREYDDFGFLSRLTYPNGRILVYQPDALNRIRRIENREYGASYPGQADLSPQRLIVENTYRGLRIGKKAYGNDASTAYAFDGAGRVISIAHRNAQDQELLTIQHLYDAAGNMRFKREFAPNGNYGEMYKYDSRSQLTLFEAVHPPPTDADRLDLGLLAPTAAALPDKSLTGQSQIIDPLLGPLAQVPHQLTFKYDKLGNRLEERKPDQPLPIIYAPNNLNQYTQRGDTHYHYDPNGNLRREEQGKTIRDYTYNHRNQIVRVNEGATPLAQFRHDPLGRRIWGYADGIESYFLYDDENEIEEWQRPKDQTPTQLHMHHVNEFWIDSHYQVAMKGDEYWYHKDLVGSTRLLTSIHGTNVVGDDVSLFRFTPFGELMNPSLTPLDAFLFAGRRHLDGLTAYDFRVRFYSPILGRFVQRDPGSSNTGHYTYASNNPLVRLDPKGRQDASVSEAEELIRLLASGSKAQERYFELLNRNARDELRRRYEVQTNPSQRDYLLKSQCDAILDRHAAKHTLGTTSTVKGNRNTYEAANVRQTLQGQSTQPPLEQLPKYRFRTEKVGPLTEVARKSGYTTGITGDPINIPEASTPVAGAWGALDLAIRAGEWARERFDLEVWRENKAQASIAEGVEIQLSTWLRTQGRKEMTIYQIFELPLGSTPLDFGVRTKYVGFVTSEKQLEEYKKLQEKGEKSFRIFGPISIFAPQPYEKQEPVAPTLRDKHPQLLPAR
jgi:RHS repeat-associated protein